MKTLIQYIEETSLLFMRSREGISSGNLVQDWSLATLRSNHLQLGKSREAARNIQAVLCFVRRILILLQEPKSMLFDEGESRNCVHAKVVRLLNKTGILESFHSAGKESLKNHERKTSNGPFGSYTTR